MEQRHKRFVVSAEKIEETRCNGFGELLAFAGRPDWIGAVVWEGAQFIESTRIHYGRIAIGMYYGCQALL